MKHVNTKGFSKTFAQLAAAMLLSALPGISMASFVEPTPVPEPGPMGLLILGGVALVIARRFKRNK